MFSIFLYLSTRSDLLLPLVLNELGTAVRFVFLLGTAAELQAGGGPSGCTSISIICSSTASTRRCAPGLAGDEAQSITVVRKVGLVYDIA